MNEPYRIVLVDDEDDIRGRIASKIKEHTGFIIVGSAGNGYDALEMLEEHTVDLVLTDIQMPFVDGIELARSVRRDYPQIKIAFITGYDEFHYAKEAISLKVDAYLMKPVTSQEIASFLSSIKQELDAEQQQLQEITEMKEQVQVLLPKLADSYMVSLLQQDQVLKTDIDTLRLYNIHLGSISTYYTCIATFDKNNIELAKKETVKVQLKELFRTVFSEHVFVYPTLVADDVVCVISIEVDDRELMMSKLAKLRVSARHLLDIDIFVGVSSCQQAITTLPSSYIQAKRVIGYVPVYGYGSTICYDELDETTSRTSLFSLSDYYSFDRVIQFGSQEDIIALAETVLQSLQDEKLPRIREYINIDIAGLLLYLMRQASIAPEQLFDAELYSLLEGYTSYQELINYLKHICIQIQEFDHRRMLSQAEMIARHAAKHITDHYQDAELSLDLLSTIFNVSPSYLSALFKKHIGTTFSKYMIQVRIEKAKELLLSTEMKVIDISILVGYKDVYYFSHSFKKVVGISPREYRNHEMV